jgi:hypothetical protein
MADPTTPPPPPPPPPPGDEPQRTRSSLNQTQADDLDKAEQLCQVAQQADFAAALNARGIDSAFITAFENDIAAARSTAAGAVSGTASRQSATAAESDAMDDLKNAIRETQAAAKQKYTGGDTAQLGNYYVGEPLKQRGRLEQIAAAIADRLGGATPADTLPGINAAKVAQLRTLLTAYRDTNVAQTAAQGAATGARSTLSTELDSINKRRRQIQFAADAEWAFTKQTNAAIRRQFQLPATRPFNA